MWSNKFENVKDHSVTARKATDLWNLVKADQSTKDLSTVHRMESSPKPAGSPQPAAATAATTTAPLSCPRTPTLAPPSVGTLEAHQEALAAERAAHGQTQKLASTAAAAERRRRATMHQAVSRQLSATTVHVEVSE